jgi:hypothetical protein
MTNLNSRLAPGYTLLIDYHSLSAVNEAAWRILVGRTGIRRKEKVKKFKWLTLTKLFRPASSC